MWRIPVFILLINALSSLQKRLEWDFLKWYNLHKGYNTQVSLLFKSSCTSLCFYEKPILLPVFANQKKCKVDFPFYDKRQEAKSVQYLFCYEPVWGQLYTLSSKSGPTKLCPQEPHLASQHQATRTLNYVCKYLCHISICFVHPFVGGVWRYQKKPKRGYFLGLGMVKSFSM